MTTDRLFVILLVMLIPMTGCFGAVGDADAESDQENNDEQPEKFTVGKQTDITTYEENGWYYPYNFTTSSGELVEVHFFGGVDYDDESSGIKIEISCDQDRVAHYYGWYGSSFSSSEGGYLYGSHSDCEHKVMLKEATPSKYPAFSLVYSIHEATVLQPN